MRDMLGALAWGMGSALGSRESGYLGQLYGRVSTRTIDDNEPEWIKEAALSGSKDGLVIDGGIKGDYSEFDTPEQLLRNLEAYRTEMELQNASALSEEARNPKLQIPGVAKAAA